MSIFLTYLNKKRKWYKGITIPKDPADVIEVELDYGPLLQADTISTKTVVGTNITIDSSSISGNVVTIWLSGGTSGTDASVTTTIVTAQPRTIERSFIIDVEDL